MKTIIINIGDELLIGQVVNTNASWLGDQLHEAGIEVKEVIMIQDELEEIVSSLKDSLSKVDLVLMTGGLGPTKDDITKKALAEYFGVSMKFDEETYERIKKLFERLGRTPTPSHKEQCFMPENAELLYNKMGTAPGMWMEENNKVVVSMPGVPYEMKWVFENSLIEKMSNKFHTKNIYHRTILTVGMGESKIAEKIEGIVDNFPQNMKMAYLPSLGNVRLRVTGTGDIKAEIKDQVNIKVDEITKLIPELVYGYDKTAFEDYIGQLLRDHQLMLATAESCTGGYIAHKITSVPGSSDYFSGSIVSYSNAMKKDILGVKEETLETHGAVSEETVTQMVSGLLEKIDADVGIAVSGIAGPGGGSEEKPVGTIWLAVGSKKQIVTDKLKLGKNRITNIKYTAIHALNMLRKFLLAQ